MLDKKFLIDYFKKSVRIDSSSTNSDPAYNFSDEDVWNIFKISIMAHNPLYSENNLPDEDIYFVILKAKEEVYYRLATTSAPFYPISAEGAELRKDYRFEHYMSLVRRIEQEYTSLWDKKQENPEVQVVNVFIDKYHYWRRNYNQAHLPIVTILRTIPHQESVDLEWEKFKVFSGLFWKYEIYVDTSPIYDEFEDIISPTALKVLDETDIHHNKVRIKSLTAGTNYHILVVASDRNGLKGLKELETTTLPIDFKEV